MKTINKTIYHCTDCIFMSERCSDNDFAICKVENRAIMNENGNDVPKWCPLKRDDITLNIRLAEK